MSSESPNLEKRIFDLDDPTIDDELDQAIAERLGTSVEELNRPLEPGEKPEPLSEARLSALSRSVTRRYLRKKNADA